MKIDPEAIRQVPSDDTSSKEEIKNDILDKFRSINAKAGDILPPRWLNPVYFTSLNPKQKEVFEEAIQELIDENLIEKTNGNIALTREGVNRIY